MRSCCNNRPATSFLSELLPGNSPATLAALQFPDRQTSREQILAAPKLSRLLRRRPGGDRPVPHRFGRSQAHQPGRHAADDERGGVREVDGGQPRRGSAFPRRALGPLPGARRPTDSGTTQQARVPADAARGVRCLKQNPSRAYEHAFLDIGYGVTISGPHVVRPHDQRHRRQARREGARDRHRLGLPVGLPRQPHRQGLDDRDHQAAGRAHARHLRRADRDAATPSTSAITTKNADGYYGWEEAAPFDKIIVTCGIDHIPPPLLQQLKAGGIMVIPVGPPGAQRVLKVVKEQAPTARSRSRARTSTAARSCPSCRSPSSMATHQGHAQSAVKHLLEKATSVGMAEGCARDAWRPARP